MTNLDNQLQSGRKQGLATKEDISAWLICAGNVRKAKMEMELRLATKMKDKKVFFRYIRNKKKTA